MLNVIGRDFGRYHVVEQLGEGGMASVFKAYDNRLERYVALKVIKPTGPQSAEFFKRFEREAKALARLSHPHIVKVHDYGEEGGLPYLVMEFIPGGTLKNQLGYPMPYAQAARLLAPVGRALEYAHNLDIVHRDIKPANILLTASGQPMLSDFGIAKIITPDAAELTATGVGIGTPEYMAPEQGQGGDIDRRADVYSLGIVFYELVTGRKPYMADTPLAIVVKHITEPLPRPRVFAPNLPEEVERVIFKATAKDRSQRYQSMASFADTLEKMSLSAPAMSEANTEVLQPSTGATLPAAPPYAPPASTRPERTGFQPQTGATLPPQGAPPPYAPPAAPYPEYTREGSGGGAARSLFNPWIIAIALILILGMGAVAVIVWGLIFLSPRETAASETLPAFAGAATPTRAMPARATPTEKAGGSEEAALPTRTARPTNPPTNVPPPAKPTVPPLPRLVAYAVGDPGYASIFISDENGGSRRALAGKGGDYDQAEPSWSADGKYVLFEANYKGTYDIWMVERGGGSPVQMTDATATDEREPDWSLQGALVYRVSPRGASRDQTGNFEMILPGSKAPQPLGIQGRGPAWSPDGSQLAYMSDQSGIWQIYVYNTDNGEVRQLTSGGTNCRWPAWSRDGQMIAFNVTTDKKSATPAGVWIIPAAGGSPQELAGTGKPGRPNISTDGLVLFNTDNGIEVMRLDGSGRQVLIDDQAAWAPAWSR